MAKSRADFDYTRAVANSDYLSNKYGGTPEQWKGVATASLIGAEISDSYSKWANSSIQASAIEARQNQITARADVSVANIFAKGEAVKSAQAGAFIKSGVKLEGSALNVMHETANKATEAAKIRQLEADFENTQLEVQRRMMQVQAEMAPLEFMVGAGSAYAKGQIY